MLQLRGALTDPLTVTLCEAADGAECTVLTVSPDGTAVLDRSASSLLPSSGKTPVSRAVPVDEENEIFVAVDETIVEVLVNGVSLTGRIYPTCGERLSVALPAAYSCRLLLK